MTGSPTRSWRWRLGRLLGFAGGLCLVLGLISSAGTQGWAQSDRGRGAGSPFGHGGPEGASWGDPGGGSHPGSLAIRPGSTTHPRFDDLAPGQAATRTIDYAVTPGGSPVDLWLIFDRDSASYQAFTGARSATDSPRHPAGGLGPYAYLAIADSNGGPAFESGNLQFVPGSRNGAVSCPIDPRTGRGGSDDLHRGSPVGRWFAGIGSRWGPGPGASAGRSVHAWTYPVTTPPSERELCGVPGAIQLASHLRSGATGTISITLGLDPTFSEQDMALPTLPFSLVALQQGAPNPCPAPRRLPWPPPRAGAPSRVTHPWVTSRW